MHAGEFALRAIAVATMLVAAQAANGQDAGNLSNARRPDKFPLDTVIFTGAMPLEEFKREYAVEYARLQKSGELQHYLVDAPSQPLTLGSKTLGFALVATGLALLVMMAIGFGGHLS